jgi:hypothetical protein
LTTSTISAFTLIERHSDTITEIDCFFVPCVPSAVNSHWSARPNRALHACKRLEILTHAGTFNVNAWLGLSQLHTLRGVNLADIYFGAIARALPRLHTLDAFTYGASPSSAAVGFFEDLLPRLRSFHFAGWWPERSTSQTAPTTPPNATAAAPLQDLPLLRELVLDVWLDPDVARGFLGARPVLLRLPYTLFKNVDCLLAASSATDAETSPAAGFLSRVRNLAVFSSMNGPCLSASGLARVLQTATELEALTVTRLEGDFLFDANPESCTELVHPRLRSIDVERLQVSDSIRADGVAWLRRLCFPRLRRLTIRGQSPDVYQ